MPAGYAEARQLLYSHYGDPCNVSSAYISKRLAWPQIRHDDSNGLKRFSYFLITCHCVTSVMSDMTVLNHVSNMQAIVQKLPAYAQNDWGSAAASIRRTEQRYFQYLQR